MSIPRLASLEDVRDAFFPGTPVAHSSNFTSGRPHNKVVVHIGARSGSSRIKDKNIRELNGIPLLGYSILVAKAMGADRVILNTDSEEYCRIGERFGAECPFLRPPALCQSRVSPGLASYYAIRKLLEEGYPVGYWIEMYPTSPFRSVPTMKRHIRTLKKAGTCTVVNRIPAPPNTVYLQKDSLEPAPLDYAGGLVFYKALGTFLGSALDAGRIHWRQYEAVTDPIELIDIDTEADWRLAENVVTSGLYDFGVAL